MKNKVIVSALLVMVLSIGAIGKASAYPHWHGGWHRGFYGPRVSVGIPVPPIPVPAPVVVNGGYYNGGYYGGGYYGRPYGRPYCGPHYYHGGGYYRGGGWCHRGYRGWR